jgi:hypothetical protein
MSRDSYRRLRVTDFGIDSIDGDEYGDPVERSHATVTDGHVAYTLQLEDGLILEVAITPVDGKPIRPGGFQWVPMSYLMDAVRGRELEESVRAFEALEDGEPPTPKEVTTEFTTKFAAAWRETPRSAIVDGKRITRRHQLAKNYGVPVWRVDEWSKAARDMGLITKDLPGRPARKKKE